MSRRRAGRRQERLARRNDQPARRCRHPRAGRLRDDRLGLPRVPGARGLGARESRDRLSALDVDDVDATGPRGRRDPRLARCGAACPERCEREIARAYAALDAKDAPDASFAVRSSATAEDLPDASFAGQQETFLNINGLDNVLHAIKEVFASLYNDRAIAYRVHKGFAARRVALSAGVQRMVRSDTGRVGRHVHAGHGVGLRQGRVHHRRVRAGRDGRAGRGQPGRVLRLQAQPRRRAAGDPAQDGRQQGDQDGVRRRASRPASRRRPSTCRSGAQPLLDHRRRSPTNSRATR